MTGTNHTLTGLAIVTLVPRPLVALPLALLSHFVLDSLPHFGVGDRFESDQRRRLFRIVVATDVLLIAVLVPIIVIAAETPIWLALFGMFLAFLPDLAWIYRFVVVEKFGSFKASSHHKHKINQLHADIQKYERPWGIIVEFIWFVAVMFALFLWS